MASGLPAAAQAGHRELAIQGMTRQGGFQGLLILKKISSLDDRPFSND